MWKPPPRPSWVVRLNAVGESLGGAEHLVALGESSLIETARGATGLDDFGPGTWREAFRVLVGALEGEARLNTVGRVLARSELVRALENRLRVARFLHEHPEIGAERIDSPVFIVGLARTGTSILHELLACDRRTRVPLTWEVMFSTPPESPASGRSDRPRAAGDGSAGDSGSTAGPDRDPRIALAELDVTLWHEIAPEYLTMHENGAELPAECIFLMAQEFRSNQYAGCHAIPTYVRWLSENGLGPAYAYHRRMLRLLQWRDRRERWVLKAPSHLSTLAALFEEYPDARVVLTHRDPLEALPSTISLMATLRHMRSDHVDVAGLARDLPMGLAAGLERVAAQRANGDLPSDRIFDLRYADLLRDPLAAVGSLYDWLGVTLDAPVRRRMSAHLATRPKGRHGAHAYALGDFDLDAAVERRRFAAYRERYGLTGRAG